MNKKSEVFIIGAGISGLSAAFFLSKKGFKVTILEKAKLPGGMTSSFKSAGWKYQLEKTYHHWFTNDKEILSLAKEIGHEVNIYSPVTSVFLKNNLVKFDTVLSVLKFPYFPFLDKMRFGFSTLILKLTPQFLYSEKTSAMKWLINVAGKNVTKIIWEPLLYGKFGKLKNYISISWFWARIKKRTAKLAYPKGGFFDFTNNLVRYLRKSGVDLYFGVNVKKITPKGNKLLIVGDSEQFIADKVLITLPTNLFIQIVSGLPQLYRQNLMKIKHLCAQVVVLVLKKSFMNKTYWLNILERKFPFLVLVEHTNFIVPKNYGGKHILYIGNYLDEGHKLLKKDINMILQTFLPFLKNINSNIDELIEESFLFEIPKAQPIHDKNYYKYVPQIRTPIKNVYLSNMDMIHPWDRGTNFSVEMSKRVANIMFEDNKN